ncbi:MULTISPECIES: hypothetical protein [Streptomyces]|uniref:Uncharacterized protein n=1 Tax=Streptomyces pratisoli TaxID=3139917 RepID=A0ACC6QA22_9ACTN|nr:MULTISPECIES: hypothetical protein [unclassified Streptomyces]MCX4511097.1 hypothetical protein [Streptomyces sp. NBC_01619]
MTAEPLLSLSSVLSDAGIDPYRFPGARDSDGLYSAMRDEDDLLPPEQEERLPIPLAAHDRRRLDLHSALTTTGVAPRPGDLDAINILCALDDRTVATVLRWITVAGPRPARAC